MKALLLALFLLVGVFGGPPATLKVSPKNQFASTKESITFYITIKPHLDNGAFCFGFEGEDTRTSCQELDNKSPPTFREILKLKGVGAYTGFVSLYKHNDHNPYFIVTDNFYVIGE